MQTKKITKLASFITALFLVFSFSMVASAATNTKTTTKPTSAEVMAKLKERAGKEIDRRVEALNKLSTRISEMKKVSETQKATLATEVQNHITVLTTLKAKIDTDADIDTLKTDVKSITGSYRVFALVMPRIHILAAADRINTLVVSMNELVAKLQVRIADAKAAGQDVTAIETALTDMNAKIADAQFQANGAIGYVTSLVPDNGDKTQMGINTAALKRAQLDIQIGNKDLQTAKKDAETIIKGLKAFNNPNGAEQTTTGQ